MIIDLTGMELANASLLDEPTPAPEGMTMWRRLSKSSANTVFADQDCHPQTIAVIKTRAHSLGYEVIVADPYHDLEQHDFFALIVQYPGSKGEIRPEPNYYNRSQQICADHSRCRLIESGVIKAACCIRC